MARLHFPELLPGYDSPACRAERLRRFWFDAQELKDPGAISWEVWDDYRFRVTDALYNGLTTDNLALAESLTCEVLFFYLGGSM